MHIMLFIYGNEAAMAAAPKETAYADERRLRRLHGGDEEIRRACGGERLKPTQRRHTVRIANGKTNVLDGPYADTKEQLAGFYMIECRTPTPPSSWAARCPAASAGTMEVRPIWPMTRRFRDEQR